jgi:hypothetical protein
MTNRIKTAEWDNWYVIDYALEPSGMHRYEEIRKLALYRIKRIFELFQKDDGGMSDGKDFCITEWCGLKVCDRIRQGDAFGLGLYSCALRKCAEIGGINKQAGIPDFREEQDKSLFKKETREKLHKEIFGK